MGGKWANKHLHGVKVEQLVSTLVDHYGWEKLAEIVSINCFKKNPSVKSSVKFLLKTPWALVNIQELYIALVTESPAESIVDLMVARAPAKRREPSMKKAPSKEEHESAAESTAELGAKPAAKPRQRVESIDDNDPWAKAKNRRS